MLLLLLLVVDVVVVVVLQKTPNYKSWGWDRSSDMQMLFEDYLARPSHPLHVEMSNKQGACVLKIKCRS